MTAALVLLLAADWIAPLGGHAERDKAGNLTGINLRATWVTDTELDRLRALPHLARLDLSLTRITDQGMQRLKSLPGVTELNLFYCELVTDEGVAAIRGWKKLARLNLRGTKITDNTLAMLSSSMTALKSLDIGYAEVTDAGLQNLSALRALEELALGGNKLNEVGLQVLISLPNLKKLDLSGRQRTDSGLWFVAVTDFALEPVATLRELRELNVSGTQVSSRGLSKLSALTKLEKLDLHGARRIADDAAGALAAFPALQWVDLKDTTFTAAGVAELRKANPRLIVAWE